MMFNSDKDVEKLAQDFQDRARGEKISIGFIRSKK